ncbi:nitroreductase [Sulfitobacter sp. JB4-11]|uniref:nitroreductase n=1 Tax=Sulfitobacter rhodophyticola TaxID=3238304 RepID=UPI003D8188B5
MTQDYDTLHTILTARHSCRAFLPDPLPDALITRIVTAARRAPSWCNAQPWQLEITRGDSTNNLRAALTEAATAGTLPQPDLQWPGKYLGVYADRRRACGFQLYDAVGVEKSDHVGRQAQMLRNYAFFDAPHVAILHAPAELGPHGVMDCGGFITAFMLAATACGVGTIAQAAVAAYAPLLHDRLDIPQERTILCAISLGYPDTDDPANGFRTDRAEPADIIRWHD